jgi:hypothetical protein
LNGKMSLLFSVFFEQLSCMCGFVSVIEEIFPFICEKRITMI